MARNQEQEQPCKCVSVRSHSMQGFGTELVMPNGDTIPNVMSIEFPDVSADSTLTATIVLGIKFGYDDKTEYNKEFEELKRLAKKFNFYLSPR